MKPITKFYFVSFLFLALGFAKPATAWEKLCSLEGAGLGNVSFLAVDIYRQSGNNGLYDYLIYVPVGVADTCHIPGQHPVGYISVKFYMTHNNVLDAGEYHFYKGNHEVRHTITGKHYMECIDSDWSWRYECKF